MDNLILFDFDKKILSNPKKIIVYEELISVLQKENKIVIILNEPYLNSKSFLENNNIYYDYLISNNTLFSKNGEVLCVKYLKNFNIELFLSEMDKKLFSNNLSFYDEYGITGRISNLVQISIKTGIFNNYEELIGKLKERNIQINKSKGCININPKDSFLKCLDFLSNNEDYQQMILFSKNKKYNEYIKKYNEKNSFHTNNVKVLKKRL